LSNRDPLLTVVQEMGRMIGASRGPFLCAHFPEMQESDCEIFRLIILIVSG